MATITKTLGTFYGYANGNTHGQYSCVLTWDTPIRTGKKVKIPNLKLTMTRYNTGWTAHRFACKGYVKANDGTSQTTFANNTTLNSYGTESPASIVKNFGSPEIETLKNQFTLYIEIASTGGSTSWGNFKSTNLKNTYTTLSCPSANPTFTVSPSITDIQETSFIINMGTTDIDSVLQYKVNSIHSSWQDASQNSITISGLTAGKNYSVDFIAKNKNDTTLTTTINKTADTYQYPHITSIAKETLKANETQQITFYNPLKRNIRFHMTSLGTDTTEASLLQDASLTSENSYSFILDNNSACKAVGEENKEGLAIYTCTYEDIVTTYSKEKDGQQQQHFSFLIDELQSQPFWSKDISLDKIILYKDINSKVVEITKNDQILIQGYSVLCYGVNFNEYPATASPFSEIKSYEVSINGGAFIDITQQSSNTPNLNADVIPQNAGIISIRVIARDKRNFETPILTRNILVSKYNLPSGMVTAEREGGYGDTIVLTVTPSWGINQNNAGTGVYCIKENGGEYGDPIDIEVFNQPFKIFNKNNESVFGFQITLTDKLGGVSKLAEAQVGAGQPILFIDSEQAGVGVNCFPEGKGLYVQGYTHLEGTSTIKGTVEINGSAEIKEYLISGAHRAQMFNRDGEPRSGWFYNGGE